MRTKRKSAQALPLIIAIITALLFVPGMVKAGTLEPSAPPGPTMKTLDQMPPTWSIKLPAADRFVVLANFNHDAVQDKETGLVWAKNANIAGEWKSWQDAIGYCRALSLGGRKGWRLPSVEELASLVDPTVTNPVLPAGHPFINVQSFYYWSSTAYESDIYSAWYVHMNDGSVAIATKPSLTYVWPVRAGK